MVTLGCLYMPQEAFLDLMLPVLNRSLEELGPAIRTTQRGTRMMAALRRRWRKMRKPGDAHEEGAVFKVSPSALNTCIPDI